MKKSKFPKLNVKMPRIEILAILRFVFLVGFTVVGLTSLLIALPKTEEYLNSAPYNIDAKNSEDYWKAGYIIEMVVKDEDKDDTRAKIIATKNILEKRLSSFGVEEYTINNYTYSEDKDSDDESTTLGDESVSLTGDLDGVEVDQTETAEDVDGVKHYIRVVVQSSKNQEDVERLLGSRSYIRILTPKDGIDFADPENQIAPYLPESYNRTQFTRRSFRNIAIKELDSTNGTTSYFAVFKPWIYESKEFTEFLRENAGSTVGISIDGFVNPYPVPAQFAVDNLTSGSKPDFAPNIAQTPEQAELTDILLNAGVIPVELQLIDNEPLSIDKAFIDYQEAAVALFIGSIILAMFVMYRSTEPSMNNLKFALTTYYTLILWVVFLKLTGNPIDLEILLLTGVAVIYSIKMLYFNTIESNKLKIISLVTLGVFAVLFGGLAGFFAEMLFMLLLLAVGLKYLVELYVNNMITFLIK